MRPRVSGGTFSRSRAFLPTLVSQISASCSTDLTCAFSLSRQNHPGRIDTSISPGIHCLPKTFPRASVSRGGAPAPGVKPATSKRLQLVSPATPRSLPIQRHPGPTSLNRMAFGLKAHTASWKAGQSYSWRFPFGPSPHAPSNHCSKTGPYRPSCTLWRVRMYFSLYAGEPYAGSFRSHGEI